MNRGNFLKGLLGLGAASLVSIETKAEKTNSFKDCIKIIDKKSEKICRAFVEKNSENISQKDYDELSEAYDIFLEEFLKEDGSGNGSDVHFKKAVFSKIRYNILKGNINESDKVFLKYFGDIHTVVRIHFNNKIDILPSLAIAHKHYAEHLLYYNHLEKAKTKFSWFRQNCNEYALSKLSNKRIWFSLENDCYKNDFKFVDKFSC